MNSTPKTELFDLYENFPMDDGRVFYGCVERKESQRSAEGFIRGHKHMMESIGVGVFVGIETFEQLNELILKNEAKSREQLPSGKCHICFIQNVNLWEKDFKDTGIARPMREWLTLRRKDNLIKFIDFDSPPNANHNPDPESNQLRNKRGEYKDRSELKNAFKDFLKSRTRKLGESDMIRAFEVAYPLLFPKDDPVEEKKIWETLRAYYDKAWQETHSIN